MILLLLLVQDAYEPNDTYEEARAIEPTATLSITFHKEKEQDFFRMEIPERGYLTFVAQGVRSGIWPTVDLYDSERKLLRSQYLPPDLHLRVEPGPFVFSLREWAGKVLAEACTVSVTFRKEFDPHESDESVKPGAVPVILYPPGDVDRLRFAVDREGLFEAAVAKKGDQDLRFDVYDAQNKLVAQGRNELAACWRALPGAYTMQIRDAANRLSDVAVEFRLGTVEAFEDEPDDQPVELDAPHSIRLHPAGDVDSFTVEATGYGRLRCVPQTSGIGFSATAEFFDENGKSLGANSIRVRPSRYRIRVREPYGTWSSPRRFDAMVEFVDSLDPFEPNDTPEEAKPLTLPSLSRFTTEKGDPDWFRITFPEEGILTVYVGFPARQFPLSAELRTKDGSSVRPIDLGWAGLRLMRVPAGEHLFRIQSSRGFDGAYPVLTLELTHYRKGETIDLGFRPIAFGMERNSQELEQIALLAELGGQKLLKGENVAEAVAALETAVTEEREKSTSKRERRDPTYRPIPEAPPEKPSNTGAWIFFVLAIAAAGVAVAALLWKR